jgi:hypothetical protein
MAKTVKSHEIEEKIADLQRQLEAAKQAESEAADQELLRLVHKADIRGEMIELARKKLDQLRGNRRGAGGEP